MNKSIFLALSFPSEEFRFHFRSAVKGQVCRPVRFPRWIPWPFVPSTTIPFADSPKTWVFDRSAEGMLDQAHQDEIILVFWRSSGWVVLLSNEGGTTIPLPSNFGEQDTEFLRAFLRRLIPESATDLLDQAKWVMVGMTESANLEGIPFIRTDIQGWIQTIAARIDSGETGNARRSSIVNFWEGCLMALWCLLFGWLIFLWFQSPRFSERPETRLQVEENQPISTIPIGFLLESFEEATSKHPDIKLDHFTCRLDELSGQLILRFGGFFSGIPLNPESDCRDILETWIIDWKKRSSAQQLEVVEWGRLDDSWTFKINARIEPHYFYASEVWKNFELEDSSLWMRVDWKESLRRNGFNSIVQVLENDYENGRLGFSDVQRISDALSLLNSEIKNWGMFHCASIQTWGHQRHFLGDSCHFSEETPQVREKGLFFCWTTDSFPSILPEVERKLRVQGLPLKLLQVEFRAHNGDYSLHLNYNIPFVEDAFG